MCRQDEAGFPQKQLETAFLHSLRLLEQNREYLQMHLQPLKDARTAQALEDMEQEAARLERTFRELMELSAPEEPVQAAGGPVPPAGAAGRAARRDRRPEQHEAHRRLRRAGAVPCLGRPGNGRTDLLPPAFERPACRCARRERPGVPAADRAGHPSDHRGRWLRPAGREAGSKTAAAFWAVRRRGCCSAAGIAASWAGSLPCCPAHRRGSG